MKPEKRIFIGSVVLGCAVWFIDSIVDYLFFFRGTFWESFAGAVAPHDAYMRIMMMVIIPLAGAVIARGVAKRRRVEEALADSEKALRSLIDFNQTILDTIPFGMEIVDEHGTVLFMNKKLEAAFGPAAVGKKCWELYKDNKQQCEACPLKGDFLSDKVRSIEVKHVLGGKTFLITHTGMIYEGKKAVLEIFQDMSGPTAHEEGA